MGDLSNLDRTVARVLREAGVLLDLELDAAMGSNGQAVCMCSDGDQMVDHVVHQIRTASRGGKPARLHTFALHGGGMLLSPGSGLYDEHDVAGLLHTHFVQAESPDLKGIDTAVLSIHTPCGAAAMVGMSLVAQIWHLVEAVRRVQAIDTNNELVATLHVDYGQDEAMIARAIDPDLLSAIDAIADIIDAYSVQDRFLLLPPDTHRRRTYRIDTEAFVAFWHKDGREIWGDLFDKDPCPPPRRVTHSTLEVLPPARPVPMGTTSQGRQADDGRR